MLTPQEDKYVTAAWRKAQWLVAGAILFLSLVYQLIIMEVRLNKQTTSGADPDLVENGIHTSSGLIAADGYEIVAPVCGRCHSLKLVTQNRANREGWEDIIRWMQTTQKLEDLGDREDAILNYLAQNYGPVDRGRRKPLENIDWYALEQH